MEDTEKKSPFSFWRSVPGLLTGLAALVTAVAGLLVTLHQVGVIGSKHGTKQEANQSVEGPTTEGVSKVASRREKEPPRTTYPAEQAAKDQVEVHSPHEGQASARNLAPFNDRQPVMSIYYAEREPTVGRGSLYAEGPRHAFLDDFRQHPANAVVVVIGYAYEEGSPAEIDELSRQRAEGVKKYLEKVGIPADQIHAAGHGAKDPTFSQACTRDASSVECANSRRRVDLFWSSWLTEN